MVEYIIVNVDVQEPFEVVQVFEVIVIDGCHHIRRSEKTPFDTDEPC